MVTRKRIEASVFVEFLKRLMHGWGKSIFLIVDGHPTHKARLVKTFLERMKGKLRLFYLPPYSPELNPDEYVWNDVKNNAVGRSMITNTKNLRSAVTSRLRYLQTNPKHVRTFFKSDTTRYAA
jgi:transposase